MSVFSKFSVMRHIKDEMYAQVENFGGNTCHITIFLINDEMSFLKLKVFALDSALLILDRINSKPLLTQIVTSDQVDDMLNEKWDLIYSDGEKL